MSRILLIPAILAVFAGPAGAVAPEEPKSVPFDLTCPIEEHTETLAEGVSVTHHCYGIRGHAIVHRAEIDLTNPRLQFRTTPPATTGELEFNAQTASDFARQFSLSLAINAGYFEPFNSGTHGEPAYPQAGDPVNVMGQHISDGAVVSDDAIGIPRFRMRVDGAFCATWNAVRIVDGACPPGTEQAVGAGPILMQDGSTPAFEKFDARFAIKRAPRTVIAYNRDRSTLWFIVVDGRQKDYSEGINLPELADLLRGLGAWDALNLDGGGSSVMVGPEGRLLSRPIQQRVPGKERIVANHIGLYFADP